MSSRLILLAVAGAILVVILATLGNPRGSASGRLWSAEHGHYHDASGREVAR